MEGFLLKKGRGESSFGRRTWKKRWVVLDGQYLTYYEDFNLQAGKAVNKKGMVSVKGCEIKNFGHKNHKFSFVLTSSDFNPLYFAANDEPILNSWMTALKKGAMGIGGVSKIDFTEYFLTLNLKPDEEMTMSLISKAYRRSALKAHPDKGGDIKQFDKVQEAFDILKIRFKELEELKLYDSLHYVVEIEKGPPGVGLGLKVAGDQGAIQVTAVRDVMRVRNIEESSKGCVKPKDFLVGVEEDDVSQWPLLRIIQRLNDYRVPVGNTVKLTFSRRLKKDGTEIEVDLEEEAIEREKREAEEKSRGVFVPRPQEEAESCNVSERGDGERSHPAETSFDDIDEGEYIPPHAAASTNVDISYTSDNMEYSALYTENEELKHHVDQYIRKLRNSSNENSLLKNQIQFVEQEYHRMKKGEELAKLQLHQMTHSSAVTDDQMRQSMVDMMRVTEQLECGEEIRVSVPIKSYLERLGLTEAVVSAGSIHAARRRAIMAAASVDSTGLVIQKWSMGETDALSKLQRLEEMLSNKNVANYGASQFGTRSKRAAPAMLSRPPLATLPSPSRRASAQLPPPDVNAKNNESVPAVSTASTSTSQLHYQAHSPQKPTASQLAKQKSKRPSPSSSKTSNASSYSEMDHRGGSKTGAQGKWSASKPSRAAGQGGSDVGAVTSPLPPSRKPPIPSRNTMSYEKGSKNGMDNDRSRNEYFSASQMNS